MAGPANALPDARDELAEIRSALGPCPAYFLDYDGTLAPIVEDPEKSAMDESASRILDDLSADSPVAVVSGRNAADVAERVALSSLIYAGSHGQEILFPDGTIYVNPESLEALEQVELAARDLQAALESLDGIYVEKKRFAIAVHTRRAGSEGDRLSAAMVADHVSRLYDLLESTTGKEVYELRPAVPWNKGNAIEYLVMSQTTECVPLFIGDDRTDEDGFAAVEALGGVGVVVSDPGDDRLTLARYRLPSPVAVVQLLAEFCGTPEVGVD